MLCPKCGKELMVEVNDYEVGTDRQDVDFVCEEEHRYFVRIGPDDLVEND